MSNKHYDVIVAGGGTAGAATALALGQRDFRVAMIDAGRQPQLDQDSPIDLRVSTLTPASCNLLDRLGRLEPGRYTCLYTRLHTLDCSDPGGTHACMSVHVYMCTCRGCGRLIINHNVCTHVHMHV